MWYINDGKSLRPYSPPKMIPYQQKTPLTFMNLYVKNFDQGGLYSAKELETTHKLFFQAHDIKLVNDDFGEGLYHADNTFSYDLSPVSSSNGFLNWASKTFRNYFGQFSHVVDAFVYTIVVLVSFFLMLLASKLQKACCTAIQRA